MIKTLILQRSPLHPVFGEMEADLEQRQRDPVRSDYGNPEMMKAQVKTVGGGNGEKEMNGRGVKETDCPVLDDQVEVGPTN